MNLKEPKRKKRASSQPQIPLPIRIDKKDEWVIYTAHLGVSATCIIDPAEMIGIHSMGYFGKGSLSRGFPTFGNRKYGAPPLIRERQWKRRQRWLEDVKKLHSKAFPSMGEEANSEVDNQVPEEKSNEEPGVEPMEIVENPEETSVVTKEEDPKNCKSNDKNPEINEVVLDSAEDEEIYEIVDREKSDTDPKDTQMDDIFILSDNQVNLPLQPSDYLDISNDSDINKEEVNLNEVLVLPDSDSDTENYLTNIKPRIETEGFPVTETLQLTFEETFFLMYGLGCLQLVDYDGKLMSIVNAWHYFNNQDKLFLPRYIVYHYFRSKGWVVKPGLQFGGDFLLYKEGPPIYHASYIVLVETVDGDSLLKYDNKTSRKMTWNNVSQMNRLSEIAAKELLIAQVLWPSTVSTTSNPVPIEALSEFTVREILWRRWKPNESDEVASLEDDDSDSDSA